jgi:hypothetical protein
MLLIAGSPSRKKTRSHPAKLWLAEKQEPCSELLCEMAEPSELPSGGGLPVTHRRPVSALLVAARSLVRRYSVLVFPNCYQHLFECRALIFDRDFCLCFSIAPVDDHSRCGELHCGRDRLIIHNRKNFVERGRRALTRKVNQFSFLPREAANPCRDERSLPGTRSDGALGRRPCPTTQWRDR